MKVTRRAVTSMLLGASFGSTRMLRAQESQVLRMTKDTPIILLPFFVAHELKLWDRSGITVSQVPSVVGMPNLIAVSGGAIDVGMTAEISVAIAALSGAQPRIIGSFVRVQAMELACTKAINSADDIRGKKIAVLQGSLSQYYLFLLLKKYGIPATAVSIVRLNPPEMISALSSGGIDGFIWQEPFLAKAVALDPSRFHRIQEPGLIELNGLIITNDATIRTKRPALVGALRALGSSYTFIKANPAEAIKIGSNWSQMDAAITADAIAKMDLSLTLDVADLSKKMTDGARWAISDGVAKPGSSIPDFSPYFVTDLLAESRQT